MPRLQAKSFAVPDDVRTMPKVRFETVGLDDATVGHWRPAGPGTAAGWSFLRRPHTIAASSLAGLATLGPAIKSGQGSRVRVW